MKYFIFISFLFLATAAGAADNSVALATGKVHEECFDMAVGQTLSYEFQASAPVNFNLHYHVKRDSGPYEDTIYETKLYRQTNLSGKYTASRKNKYCLMWRNWGHVPSSLSYNYEIFPANGAD